MAFSRARNIPYIATLIDPPTPITLEEATRAKHKQSLIQFLTSKLTPPITTYPNASTGYDYALSHVHITSTSLSTAPSHAWPVRYTHLLDGTARPPPPTGTIHYAILLGLLLTIDTLAYGCLALSCLLDRRILIFAPPNERENDGLHCITAYLTAVL